MAHSVTGKAGTVSFAGTAIAAKLTHWELRGMMKEAEDTGMGDAGTGRLGTFQDWTFTCRGRIKAGQGNYPTYTGVLGTEVAVVAKIVAGDTTPFFSDTGAVFEYNIRVPHDQPAEIELTVKSATGTAATF